MTSPENLAWLRGVGPGRRQAGFTLIEMMVSLAVMFLILSGTILFLISHARMTTSSFDRSDIQRGGRSAMSILSDKIGNAGLGLPRLLAIKSFQTNVACGGVNTPKLVVAALDYNREWTVDSTSGTTSSGTITLASPIYVTPTLVSPATADAKILTGRWVYLYQGAAPQANGIVSVSQTRAVNATTVNVGSTNYSTAQPSLNLAVSGLLNQAGSVRKTVMLLVDVAGFGVNCTNASHPFLYWEHADPINGGTVQTPIANNLDMRPLAAANNGIAAAKDDVVALRFRFQLDTDGDGQADNSGAWVNTVTIDPNSGTADDVIAIEVLLRVKSERPDPQLGAYRFEDFIEVIRVPNINTRNQGQYLFIDNTGI